MEFVGVEKAVSELITAYVDRLLKPGPGGATT
jgi:hypothetical protein